MQNPVRDDLEIHWPDHYAPDNAPVHVRNTLRIEATAESIWAWLVRAEKWPEWYSNASRVRMGGGHGPDLALDREFRWRTFGVGIRSRVREFVPYRRIAWDGHALGIDVYHAWLIAESGSGCTVITEETQHGVVARLGAGLMPRRMSTYHQLWLESLAKKAAGGRP